MYRPRLIYSIYVASLLLHPRSTLSFSTSSATLLFRQAVITKKSSSISLRLRTMSALSSSTSGGGGVVDGDVGVASSSDCTPDSANTASLSSSLASVSLSSPSDSLPPPTSALESLALQQALAAVQSRMEAALSACTPPRPPSSCVLVAVSKTHPVSCMHSLLSVGHLTFGENYVQETLSKSPLLPEDCSIHFIGPLQSNKAVALVKGCRQLKVVETVCTSKVAALLQQGAKLHRQGLEKLGVYIQIDTSLEETKSGVEFNKPEEVRALVDFIQDSCPDLSFRGVMTIGAAGDESCFDKLAKVADDIEGYVGFKIDRSMGMSGDFETAIKKGATSVRVGSSIFGARDYAKKN